MEKGILKYIKGTINYVIFYSSCNDAKLFGYCDSDQDRDATDRKYTYGYIFKLGVGYITWSSKKEPKMSIFSTETKYISTIEDGKEVMWLKILLDDLHMGIKGRNNLLYDIQSFISLENNLVQH